MNETLALFVAMTYEERRRKSWAERTRRGDTALTSLAQLQVEVGVEDLNLLEDARTRVFSVVERAGM